MCGIFGVLCGSGTGVDRSLARVLALSLLGHPEIRGHEATGMAGTETQVLEQGSSHA